VSGPLDKFVAAIDREKKSPEQNVEVFIRRLSSVQ
jgi:hypothetical protein